MTPRKRNSTKGGLRTLRRTLGMPRPLKRKPSTTQ